MDADVIRDLFAEFGPIDIRRMFSGAGVFVDGRMIALIARDVIYLKADAETVPTFEQEGLTPFTYATRNGTHTLASYWRMPERLYDDPEELARWARDAYAVALRAAARRGKSAHKKTSKTAKPKATKPKATRTKTARTRTAQRKPPKQASARTESTRKAPTPRTHPSAGKRAAARPRGSGNARLRGCQRDLGVGLAHDAIAAAALGRIEAAVGALDQ
jgi:DNA transformation protein